VGARSPDSHRCIVMTREDRCLTQRELGAAWSSSALVAALAKLYQPEFWAAMVEEVRNRRGSKALAREFEPFSAGHLGLGEVGRARRLPTCRRFHNNRAGGVCRCGRRFGSSVLTWPSRWSCPCHIVDERHARAHGLRQPDRLLTGECVCGERTGVVVFST
jgi:hypothetical protein